MSDIIDLAAAREEEHRADALAAHFRRRGETRKKSELSCVLCDAPIPDARRRALRGVTTCVDCQTELERALKGLT
jgi:phage/conjugal plasmid C-4 type zinc finger TraR family protein